MAIPWEKLAKIKLGQETGELNGLAFSVDCPRSQRKAIRNFLLGMNFFPDANAEFSYRFQSIDQDNIAVIIKTNSKKPNAQAILLDMVSNLKILFNGQYFQ